MLCPACSNETKDSDKDSEASKLLAELSAKGDFNTALRAIDSLEQAGSISTKSAHRSRGACYLYLGDPKQSEEWFRRSYDIPPKTKDDSINHILASHMLSNILMRSGKHEEVLRILLPAIKMAEQRPIGETYMNMLFTLGQCQYHLNKADEGKKSLEKAAEIGKSMMSKDSTGHAALNMLENCYNTSTLFPQSPDTAMNWLSRSKEALDTYARNPNARQAQLPILRAYILQLKACLQHKLGQTAQAEKTFAEYLASDFYHTDEGMIAGAEYLYLKGDWARAADHYEYVDTLFHHRSMEVTLDNIKEWILPRYLSNANAGRTAKTIAIGRELCQMLDTAITAAKRDKAAELATVYETQEKEAQIARQQAELSHQRIIGLIVAIILLTVFFIVYTLVRHRAARRLAEMKAAQERIESELRIAHDIQMSMVPSVFPEHQGLDMYASMTPAKEVGGDLYGYLLKDDKLYFALGDVSGKGVPASLFMAQATRLFLTLAKQGMKPAEICTRMNDALSGDDNESGMFVTFWLGLADLTTGHLEYCNAGHNPPIIADGDSQPEFLEMIPNAPIGLFPGLDYEGEQIDNIKGRTLFIYTDGLNEAENRQQEQFGDDRLLESLRNIRFSSARQLIDSLKTQVETHRDGADPNDDLTMMCLHID